MTVVKDPQFKFLDESVPPSGPPIVECPPRPSTSGGYGYIVRAVPGGEKSMYTCHELGVTDNNYLHDFTYDKNDKAISVTDGIK